MSGLSCTDTVATRFNMVFGILIDVPLIVGGFALMLDYRKRLTGLLMKIQIPTLGLYMLLSLPLIIFEEDIDCMPAWCGKVLIAPTLPFLLVEMFVLGLLALRLHAKSALRVTLGFSIFGVSWELLLGGLVGAPVVIAALLAPYVMVGYGFVSLLPLMVLLEGKRAPRPEPVVLVESAVTVPIATKNREKDL